MKTITRAELQDKEFVERAVQHDMAYIDGIPHTVSNQKVFTMICQLGKPSALLTLSASEIYWTGLL